MAKPKMSMQPLSMAGALVTPNLVAKQQTLTGSLAPKPSPRQLAPRVPSLRFPSNPKGAAMPRIRRGKV